MQRIRDELKAFRKEFRDNIIKFIAGAFSFVAALSWNDLIRQSITLLVPTHKELYYRLFSAIGITIVAVAAIYAVSKFKGNNQ